MERKKKEKIGKKILNRTFSYLILFGSIMLLSFSVFQITNYIQLNKENTQLNQLIVEIERENENLKLQNAKLRDSDYVSFYVKDNYQYEGNNKIVKIEVE